MELSTGSWLTGYLRAYALARVDARRHDVWMRPFVDVIAHVADALVRLEPHELRFGFQVHSANFHHALREAERLGMDLAVKALLQSLF